ncbi:hypothetical protein K8R42_04780 [bacterium]|nr:hypothetical protein [bacterium]
MAKKKDVQFEQPSDILILVNRYILGILGLIVLSVLVFGYLFILQPKITNLELVEEETTETEELKGHNEKLLVRIKELEIEFKDIKENREEQLNSLKMMVPENPQVAELFVLADYLATERGFQLMSIDISKDTSGIVEVDIGRSEEEVDPQSTIDDPETNTTVSDIENIISQNSMADEDISTLNALIIHMSIASPPVLDSEEGNATSTYGLFKKYLVDLENHIRLIDIQSVTFAGFVSQTEEETKDTKSEKAVADSIFNLDIITYYR